MFLNELLLFILGILFIFLVPGVLFSKSILALSELQFQSPWEKVFHHFFWAMTLNTITAYILTWAGTFNLTTLLIINYSLVVLLFILSFIRRRSELWVYYKVGKPNWFFIIAFSIILVVFLGIYQHSHFWVKSGGWDAGNYLNIASNIANQKSIYDFNTIDKIFPEFRDKSAAVPPINTNFDAEKNAFVPKFLHMWPSFMAIFRASFSIYFTHTSNVFLGFLSLISLLVFLLHQFRNHWYAIFCSFLLVLVPLEMHYIRGVMSEILLQSQFLAAMAFVSLYWKYQKRIFIVVGFVSLALMFHSKVDGVVFIPMFSLILFFWLYFSYTSVKQRKDLLYGLLSFIVILITAWFYYQGPAKIYFDQITAIIEIFKELPFLKDNAALLITLFVIIPFIVLLFPLAIYLLKDFGIFYFKALRILARLTLFRPMPIPIFYYIPRFFYRLFNRINPFRLPNPRTFRPYRQVRFWLHRTQIFYLILLILITTGFAIFFIINPLIHKGETIQSKELVGLNFLHFFPHILMGVAYIGIVLWLYKLKPRQILFPMLGLVMFFYYLYDISHYTDNFIWSVRRFISVALPLLVVGLSYSIFTLHKVAVYYVKTSKSKRKSQPKEVYFSLLIVSFLAIIFGFSFQWLDFIGHFDFGSRMVKSQMAPPDSPIPPTRQEDLLTVSNRILNQFPENSLIIFFKNNQAYNEWEASWRYVYNKKTVALYEGRLEIADFHADLQAAMQHGKQIYIVNPSQSFYLYLSCYMDMLQIISEPAKQYPFFWVLPDRESTYGMPEVNVYHITRVKETPDFQALEEKLPVLRSFTLGVLEAEYKEDATGVPQDFTKLWDEFIVPNNEKDGYTLLTNEVLSEGDRTKQWHGIPHGLSRNGNFYIIFKAARGSARLNLFITTDNPDITSLYLNDELVQEFKTLPARQPNKETIPLYFKNSGLQVIRIVQDTERSDGFEFDAITLE